MGQVISFEALKKRSQRIRLDKASAESAALQLWKIARRIYKLKWRA